MSTSSYHAACHRPIKPLCTGIKVTKTERLALKNDEVTLKQTRLYISDANIQSHKEQAGFHCAA